MEIMTATYEDVKLLLFVIRGAINKRAESIPKEKRRIPKSIMESRFTPPWDAFVSGMVSCGTMASIAASILRNFGFKVMLIHGECAGSVDHAWISVLIDSEWFEFDLTRPYLDVPETHLKKATVNSWREIEDQIISDHKTLAEREEARRISLTA